MQNSAAFSLATTCLMGVADHSSLGKYKHDWVFLGLEVYWGTGELKLRFRDQSSSQREIVCSGLKNLSLTRTLEWGMSVSVNAVEKHDVAGDSSVKIEMQSGDHLIATCQQVLFS
jgi:hypothetical protein